MIISFSPVNNDTKLSVEVYGDVLILNGVEFDFGPLTEGSTLPQRAIDCEYIMSPVTRTNGRINVTLMLPFTGIPSPEVCYPNQIIVTVDGPVELPV